MRWLSVTVDAAKQKIRQNQLKTEPEHELEFKINVGSGISSTLDVMPMQRH
jgi:hypothetical protein